MKTVKLNNGVEMPVLGFGVFQIEDAKQCEQAVSDALKAGYRLIDTASAYMNEEAVGRAIRKSGIPRKEIFLTTKLWIQDHGYEKALKAFDKSLKRLGVNYLDLYLVHQPFGNVYGSWRAMEELYKAGKIRAIGVSNFKPDRLIDLITFNEITPAVNQIETHPFCQQTETHQYQMKNGVQTESWGPFAEGRNSMFFNPILTEIAGKCRKTVAQVILRWLIQRDIVVIPKSVHKDRIEENFNVFDFELTGDDMEAIKKLDTGDSLFIDHRNPEKVKWFGSRIFDI
jgi:diketogulonate reductase-like aldo/keto reductase